MDKDNTSHIINFRQRHTSYTQLAYIMKCYNKINTIWSENDAKLNHNNHT